jgi:multiple sugar transport system permease protein
VYTSLRPYAETARKGYVSWPDGLTLQNYSDAFTQGELPRFFFNTLIIVVPALLVTLLLSSMAAFVLSRFAFRFNLLILLILTAGNLLPPQVIITPLFQIFRLVALPTFMNSDGTLLNSYWGVFIVHVAFQVGFCTFVLSNYMKMIPHELTDAALVDGASVWRQYFSIILPLCRPPLAALATLQFTWMYNDFFWALVLMVSGEKRPITSALDNLRGTFFTDNNLIAAASVLIALPTIAVYVFLQKHFVRGLTVGATKG